VHGLLEGVVAVAAAVAVAVAVAAAVAVAVVVGIAGIDSEVIVPSSGEDRTVADARAAAEAAGGRNYNWRSPFCLTATGTLRLYFDYYGVV
jgi:hypothetical protein